MKMPDTGDEGHCTNEEGGRERKAMFRPEDTHLKRDIVYFA